MQLPSSAETAGKVAALVLAIGGAAGLLWAGLRKLYHAEQIMDRVKELETEMASTQEILQQMPALTAALAAMRAEIEASRRETRANAEKLQEDVASVRESLGEVRGELRGNQNRPRR